MKICIDARSLGLRGVLPYTRCLIDSLLKIDQRNEYVIITDPRHGSWEHDGVEEISSTVKQSPLLDDLEQHGTTRSSQ
jgi:hypothetical protein